MLQHLQGPRWGLCAASTFAILLVACPPSPPPEAPRLEIFPTRVQLSPATDVNVTIAAHVRGGDGVVVTSTPIGWTLIGPALSDVGFPSAGDRIVVTVKAGALPGSRFKLQASAGTLVETVEFEILPLGPTDLDQAIANHRASDPPAVAVITAFQGTCWVDSLFPFAHRADLGNWGPGCPPNAQRAAIFAVDRAASYWDPFAWTPMGDPQGPDNLDGKSVAPLSTSDANLEINRAYPYLTIPLRIHAFDGVTVDAAFKDLVFWDVTTASAKFTEALAGVAFTYDETTIGLPLTATVRSCNKLIALLAANPDWQDPTAMNVYYTPHLAWSRRGYFCGKPSPDPADQGRPVPSNLILMSTANHSTTSLAHELGHAMAMLEPWKFRGHVDQVDGMASDNLMWANVDDLNAASRYRLSIGQIYRINRDQRSWLNNGPFDLAAPVDCGCSPYVTKPCPRLSADVRKIGNPAAALPGGTCP